MWQCSNHDPYHHHLDHLSLRIVVSSPSIVHSQPNNVARVSSWAILGTVLSSIRQFLKGRGQKLKNAMHSLFSANDNPTENWSLPHKMDNNLTSQNIS